MKKMHLKTIWARSFVKRLNRDVGIYTIKLFNKSEIKCDYLLSKISEQINKGSAPPPVESPANLPNDDEEENIAESPKNSPTKAPKLAPNLDQAKAPEFPRKYKAPSHAPQAHSPNAASPQS